MCRCVQPVMTVGMIYIILILPRWILCLSHYKEAGLASSTVMANIGTWLCGLEMCFEIFFFLNIVLQMSGAGRQLQMEKMCIERVFLSDICQMQDREQVYGGIQQECRTVFLY